MDKLRMKTEDLTNNKYEKLKELFPNAITETIDDDGNIVRAIDKDVLMQEINIKVVDSRQERYQFTWTDKNKTIIASNAPTTNTLRPCKEESINFDTSENLYIEGDNLEVLKVLKETYLGKVKCIYIDPPYNTGRDFVFSDNFDQKTNLYHGSTGQIDEVNNRLVTNLESNGRYHTDWLNMMYSRIKLSRDLLSYNGLIAISIDENELINLKKICDEIFGESNFIATLHWKKKKQPSFLSRVAKIIEYILLYEKKQGEVEKIAIDTIEDSDKPLINASNNVVERIIPSGVKVKADVDLIKKGFIDSGNSIELLNDVKVDLGRTIEDAYVKARFRTNQDNINKFAKEDLIFFTRNLSLRRDVSKEERGKLKSITDLLLDWGQNQDSDKEQIELFNNRIFDNPKPVLLIKNIIKANQDKGGYYLDFFSGSATTAHAVMRLNAEDGGNRKFIMVQLPEATDQKSEAYKSGYKYITDIGKERIRRAGKKILEENKDKEGIEKLDVGFRVLKLDSSNMKDIYYTPQDTQQSMLEDLTDNIKEDRSELDLLFQVMLDLGVELSSTIDEIEISGKKIFSVADNYLLATFDKDIDDKTITEIAKRKPVFFVMRDSSLTSDSVATNFEQIFNTYSPETTRRVL